MPTSNYLITRFFDNFVFIETDLFFFCFDRLSGLLSAKFYFSYFLSIINSFFYSRFKFRSRRFLSRRRRGYYRFLPKHNHTSFFISHLYKTFFFLFSINRLNRLKSSSLSFISSFVRRICFFRFFRLYSSILFLYANKFSLQKKLTFFYKRFFFSRRIFSLFLSKYVRYHRNKAMRLL